MRSWLVIRTAVQLGATSVQAAGLSSISPHSHDVAKAAFPSRINP